MIRSAMKWTSAALVVSLGLIGSLIGAVQQSEDTTEAGCLKRVEKKGTSSSSPTTRRRIRFSPAESVELAPHANHRVELAGTMRSPKQRRS